MIEIIVLRAIESIFPDEIDRFDQVRPYHTRIYIVIVLEHSDLNLDSHLELIIYHYYAH